MMRESLDTIVARCKLPIGVKVTPHSEGRAGWQIIGPGNFRHSTYRPEHATRAYFNLVTTLSAGPDVSPTLPPPGSAGEAAGLCDIIPMVSR